MTPMLPASAAMWIGVLPGKSSKQIFVGDYKEILTPHLPSSISRFESAPDFSSILKDWCLI